MTNTFRRRAMILAASLARAWRRGSVAPGVFRAGLALLAAAFLLIMTACYTAHGITRVGTTEQEVMAGALFSEDERTTKGEYIYFVSGDGGETWRPSRELTEVQWSEGPIGTSRGAFSIQGPDIVLRPPDGVARTVFSAASWRTSSNQWFQEIQTNTLEARLNQARLKEGQPSNTVDDRVLSKGPVAIAYDSGSGNVIAAAGIMGVVVGTPDGQWRSVAVGDYTPVELSRSAKLKALLSHNIFWATAITFPFLMMALTFSSKDIAHKGFLTHKHEMDGDTATNPSHSRRSLTETSVDYNYYVRRGRGHQLTPTAYRNLRLDPVSFISVIFLVMSFPSVAFMWVLGSGVNSDGWIWLVVMILVGASALASMIAWRGQWKVHWGGLAGSYLAMAVFIALPFLLWVQTGLPLAVPKTLAIILCLAVAVTIYLRLDYKPSSLSGLDKPASES